MEKKQSKDVTNMMNQKLEFSDKDLKEAVRKMVQPLIIKFPLNKQKKLSKEIEVIKISKWKLQN